MSAPLLYLASKSPRRQALLAQLGLEFETLRLRDVVKTIPLADIDRARLVPKIEWRKAT